LRDGKRHKWKTQEISTKQKGGKKMIKISKQKLKRRMLWLFGLFFAIAFLYTCLDSVYATLAVDETSKIPRILLQWSEYRANGNLTELKRIRTEILNQLERNEELIKSTNGAILQPQLTDDVTFNYLTYDSCSPEQYNDQYPPSYQKVAWVENGSDLDGPYQDGYYARLAALNWGQDNMWGEALTHCHTEDTLYDGYIYARAKKGVLTGSWWYPDQWGYEWCNYLIAEIALDPDDLWDWHFVYYAQVFSSSGSTYFLGDTTSFGEFNHVSISTMCPYDWTPIERSDILVDQAWIDTFG
jgi:hypothetical protein